MNTCNKAILKVGTKFASGLAGNNTLPIEVQLSQLNDILQSKTNAGISFDAEQVSKFILAALTVDVVDIRSLHKMTEAEIDAVIAQGDSFVTETSPRGRLQAVKGYSTLKEMTKTISEEAMQVKVSKDKDAVGNLTEKVDSVNDSAGGSLKVLQENLEEDFNPQGTLLAERRSSRIERTKGLKINSPASWGVFLDEHFRGMSTEGILFAEFAEDLIINSVVRFDKAKAGFSDNVNAAINELKDKIENKLSANRKNEYVSKTLKEDLVNSPALRTRYFNDILFSDFDFVMQSLIGSINVSVADSKNGNSEVIGLVDGVGNAIDSKMLNINNDAAKFFKESDAVGDSSFTLNQEDNQIYPLGKTITEFKQDRKLKRGRIYYLQADNKYFYRTKHGANIDISPVMVYAYSTKNNRRSGGIDQEMDPFDMSTAFIVNLLPMFKLFDANGTPIRRMSASDFLAIAPHLKGVGNDIDSFREALKNKASQDPNTKVAKIAASIYAYVFKETPSKGIYSLYHASQENPTIGGTNAAIVIALQNALMNFDFNRYIKQEQKYVTTTYALGEGSQDDIVNNGLAPFLVKGGLTKYSISNYLTVRGTDVEIRYAPTGRVYSVQTITRGNHNGRGDSNTPSVESVAEQLGLSPLYRLLKDSYNVTYSTSEDADKAIAESFENIIDILASNLKAKPLAYKNLEARITHSDYKRVPASSLLDIDIKNAMAVAFDVDNNKRINAGGKKMPSVEAPHRYSLMKKQVELYKKALKINGGALDFNPFLMTAAQLIEKESNLYASRLGDLFIKTPIIYDGDAIDVSEWDLMTRIKHAMIDGFLDGPRLKGKEFFVQSMNFSDKGSIPLQQIFFDENLLGADSSITTRLKKAYIEYNINKNVGLQKIMIGHLSLFIGGQYESIVKHIDESAALYSEKKAEKKARITALRKLRDILVSKSYIGNADMTRPINDLLKEINISANFIKFSDTELDFGADIITFNKSDVFKHKDMALLKPHMGVRAEAYTNHGDAMVKQALADHSTKMKDLGLMDDSEIKDSLNRIPKSEKTIKNVPIFMERFFLLNGIYGHSIKVLSMGDESYFGTYYDQKSVDDYYAGIDRDRYNLKYVDDEGEVKYVKDPNFDYGLQDVDIMLQSQFKRAQSILTRGLSYVHKLTSVGIKRASIKEDALQYMDIKSSKAFRNDSTIATDRTYSFESLYNKTFEELEGIGVLNKLPADGPLGVINPDGSITVSINVGNSTVIMSNTAESTDALIADGVDPALVAGLLNLLEAVARKSNTNGLIQSTVKYDTFYEKGPDVEEYLSVKKLIDVEEKLSKNNFTIMPDFIPTMTLSDPVSFVNVLNKMNVKQENSDAIQFIHPLLSLILDNSRGNSMGAFHTEFEEAMKFLTTTVEYDRARQVLQKKSIQNPFTMEQMEKFGGTELYNMLRSMNTAMDFKQTNMLIEVDGIDTIMEFKTLEDLFVHFNGYTRGNDSGWTDVLNTLSRKENSANLYSFVGLVSVPSNQKTGHKKLNKFESHFNHRLSEDKANIDYTANEFNFEVLSKAHAFDVSGRLRDKSTIALLSQLVSAVAVGGNTNEIAEDLQDSMSAMMDHSRLQIGAEFAYVGEEILLDPDKNVDEESYRTVIDKLFEGDFRADYAEGGPEHTAYSEIIRKAIYDIVVLALDNNMESEVTKRIAQDENLSIDHPGAKRQIMNTLRSALFKDSIKMEMPGFIATVSVGSNTMKFFDLSKGKRVSRKGYIEGGFIEGLGVKITESNIDDVTNFVMPYDYIRIPAIGKDGKPTTRLIRAGAVDEDGDPIGLTYERTPGGTYKVIDWPKGAEVVIPPDVYEAPGIRSVSAYNDIKDETTLLKISGFGVDKPGVYFKWYFEELYKDPKVRSKMLRAGNVSIDITEKYSLKWSQFTKKGEKGEIVKLESMPAYKAFYRAAFKKDSEISEKDLDNLRAALILETQERDAEGENIWEMSAPEVVLPTFMRAAYNIPQGASITDIVGFTGDPIDNATQFFTKRVRLGKEFTPLAKSTKEKKTYFQKVRRIYAKKATKKKSGGKSTFSNKVIEFLESIAAVELASLNVTNALELTPEQLETFNDRLLSDQEVETINTYIAEARENHVRAMASSFMQSLDVVLTRIPGQTKQSGFYAKVIEFMDGQGNAAFAPTEHLVTTGGDFDIDTLSVLTRAIDEKGIIYGTDDFLTDGRFDKDKLQDKYKTEIEDDRNEITTAIREANQRYEELLQVRKNKRAVATDPSTIAELDQSITNTEDAIIDTTDGLFLLRESHKSIARKYKNILSNSMNEDIMDALRQVDTAVEINTPVSFSLFQPILKRIEKKVIIKARVDKTKTWKELKTLSVYSEDGVNTMRTESKDADHMHFGNPWSSSKLKGTIQVKDIPTAVEMYKEWLTTNKYKHINPEQREWILNEIKKGSLLKKTLLYSNKKGADGLTYRSHADALAEVIAVGPKRKNISGENYMNIFEAEYTAAQGKEAIQIFATVIKINSSIQSAKMFFDRRYGDNNNFKGKNNPFFFEHDLKFIKVVDGKEVNQVESRHTFADTERFNTMNRLKTNQELKDALTGIGISDSEFKAKAPGALVDFMEEEMFNILKQAEGSTIKDYDVDKINMLSKYYGKPINGDTAKILLKRYSKKRIPAADAQAIKESIGIDVNTDDGLTAYTKWLQSRILKVNTKVFKSVARDLFGISVSADILNSEDPLKAFREYLETDIELVESSLKTAVGKTLSMDVQSQFLSAATDNAKELILARVKSNSLTNPIITSMMLLGYDINVIIDFLYDPIIEKIILEFSKKKNELQNVTLSAQAVSEIGAGTILAAKSESKKSLISILEVSEAFGKFRAVRSLNEKTKIRQEQLDKIIDDVNGEDIYKASRGREEGDVVEKGKLTALNKPKDLKNPARAIFDVDKMILLNPITFKIFRHIYEIEKYIIPSVANNPDLIRKIADRTTGKGKKEYQNIDSFISEKIVAKFYAQPIGTKETVTDEGEIISTPAYRTGAVYENGKITYVELNDRVGKGKFIDNFEAYFMYMKEGMSNAALDSMVFGKTFKATNPVLGIPKLRHAKPDSIEVSNITQGIQELKTTDGALGQDKLDFYNNLAHYAMIVSSGEGKKGTMIDIFPEINDELAAYIKTLTKKDFNEFMPKTELGVTLVKGNIPTIEKILRQVSAKRARILGQQTLDSDIDIQQGTDNTIQEADATFDDRSMEDMGVQDFVLGDGYNEQERKAFVYQGLSKEASRPVKVTNSTSGKIFRVIDKDISDAIFYGHGPKEIAYRLFPAGTKESNPIGTTSTSKFLSTIGKALMQDLSDIGMQVGYNAKYEGNDIQILSFKGTEKINGKFYEVYNIWYNGKPGTAKGVHLMADNEGLDLRKNIIRPLRSGDIEKHNNYRALLKKLPKVTREIGVVKKEAVYAPRMAAAFSSDLDVLAENIVAKKEATQIAPVITLDSQSTVSENITHNIYQKSGDLKKATKYSLEALVPAMFKTDGTTVNWDERNQINKKIMDIVNNLSVGSSVNLYGIRRELDHTFDGGMDIIDDMLRYLWDNVGKDTNTFFNGHFSATESTDVMTGMITLNIKRNPGDVNPVMQMVGNRIIPIFTENKTVEGVVVSNQVSGNKYSHKFKKGEVTAEVYKNATLAAVLDGKVDMAHKTGPIKFGHEQMQRTEYITIPPSGKKGNVFIKRPGTINEFIPVVGYSEAFSNKYYSVNAKGNYPVPNAEYAQLLNMDLKESAETIIKKGC